ncbi:MAG: cyclic peptide export ABC transporter [Bacteroidota bacterium]
MVQLFQILRQRSPLFYVALIMLSLVNSLLSIGLLMFINRTITGEPLPYVGEYAWVFFIGLVVVSFVSNKVFQTYMIKLTNNILIEFEINIIEKLRKSHYEAFENMGQDRVYTAIQDTRALGNLPEVFMNALNSLIISICCVVYLFLISPLGGFTILGVMALLLVTYLIRNRSVERDLNRNRDMQNEFFWFLGDLLRGFKEVKMSSQRNDDLTQRLVVNRNKSKAINISTAIKYLNNELTGNYSWHIVLGVVMFLLPVFSSFDRGQMVSFIITVLYLIGPVAVLITLIPTYTRVKIALERLWQFDQMINDQLNQQENMEGNTQLPDGFRSLEFEDIAYQYFDREKERTFSIGPVSLRIQEGELVFITGGNGSGKSTFINILTGLYYPKSGTIRFNDEEVTADNYRRYRDRLTAIFTNNYVFQTNYNGFDFRRDQAALEAYVRYMKLEEKLDIDYETNEISSHLSAGQRKRLAMIHALMEDNDVLVLDEWAAEQDPQFRKYFYTQFLPVLKQRGKTVIAVTHDDDYYQYADRVVKFDFGQIVRDKAQSVATEPIS